MPDSNDSVKEEASILRCVVAALKRRIDAIEVSSARQQDEITNWTWGLGPDFKTDGSDVIGWLQHIQWFRRAQADADQTRNRLARMRRQLQRPYFAGLDFRPDGEPDAESLRIGLWGFADPAVPIYDWRAPAANLYYEAEPGPASYQAPGGLVSGTLSAKHQYLIRDGQLDGAFDTTLPIGDEVLQEQMARSDSRMTNIVATIQRQQNEAIRMTPRGHLFVEGPAGSGKTSVALQRIAYMLYRERKTLTSCNILFLSPSRLFADYVSAVLPELGEDNPIMWSFDDLIAHLFPTLTFQSRLESLDSCLTLLPASVSADSVRLTWKASLAFVQDLEAYADRLADEGLPFVSIGSGKSPWIRPETLEGWFTRDLAGLPLAARLEEIGQRDRPIWQSGLEAWRKRLQQSAWNEEAAEKVEERVARYRDQLEQSVKRAEYVDWHSLYRRRFRGPRPHDMPADTWRAIGDQTLSRPPAMGIAHEDLAPLVWLRAAVTGERALPRVRMLVIDEAQDYTPCQYAALGRLFPNTYLTAVGDIRQLLHPGYGCRRPDQALDSYLHAEHGQSVRAVVRLRTCYRSSQAITDFARQILPARERQIAVAALDRPGDPPQLLRATPGEDWGRQVTRLIRRGQALGWTRIGVLARTIADAQWMADILSTDLAGVVLVTSPAGAFTTGVLVLPLALAKGLEFDAVVVGDVSRASFSTPDDRRLLYVAATRAIHHLWMIALGPTPKWLQAIFGETDPARPPTGTEWGRVASEADARSGKEGGSSPPGCDAE